MYWRIFEQELQAAYDEIQRQLQQTLDQYGVAQRKLQSLTSEYEEARANLESVSLDFYYVDILLKKKKQINGNDLPKRQWNMLAKKM